MNKVIGVSLFLAGVAILALNKNISSLPFMSNLPTVGKIPLIIVVGVVIALLGFVFLVLFKKEEQMSEVPIYQGKKIVGYRKN